MISGDGGLIVCVCVSQTMLDRKRKWQAERERCDEELEEVRRSSQQELDNLRIQLRKARTSTDQAAQGQVCLCVCVSVCLCVCVGRSRYALSAYFITHARLNIFKPFKPKNLLLIDDLI